ncbi:unnamed protein product [Leptidea sinapis]|uniref:SHC SH2 domain-containing protein n=1 Tax=Leptidea sinapis TaxID=189913 RepID=A0A5E4QJU1_9NEOP|nr:unnamed protein product [Leptidea sinapis]
MGETQNVYVFKQSYSEIRNELFRVLGSGQTTAKDQFIMHAETVIEPVGWDAMWKLSKEFCNQFVFVSVTSVNFEELTANVEVQSHTKKAIPKYVSDVSLTDLSPTVLQREDTVNAEATAEFIHLLRFFYKHLWMPWDDQEKVFLPNTLEDRLRLWNELNTQVIPNCVARQIRSIRSSAITVFYACNFIK